MMKQAVIAGVAFCIAPLGCLYMGMEWGKTVERREGQAVQERAAAIDACAREANVYPESCAMKAVVISPTMPERTAALPDLLPPPVES